MKTKVIERAQMEALYFNDINVLNVYIDTKNKACSVVVDWAYFDVNRDLTIEGPGVLTIQNWENFEYRFYTLDKKWYLGFDEIKDICEFELSDNTIELHGFGKRTGLWTEYKFTKPEAYFTFAENAKAE